MSVPAPSARFSISSNMNIAGTEQQEVQEQQKIYIRVETPE
jgi:hypothetical protein